MRRPHVGGVCVSACVWTRKIASYERPALERSITQILYYYSKMTHDIHDSTQPHDTQVHSQFAGAAEAHNCLHMFVFVALEPNENGNRQHPHKKGPGLSSRLSICIIFTGAVLSVASVASVSCRLGASGSHYTESKLQSLLRLRLCCRRVYRCRIAL